MTRPPSLRLFALLVCLWLALGGLVAAAGPTPSEPQSGAGTGEVSGKAPNIVLLTLDTTRADHLGSAGWTFASTPNLDALAGTDHRRP